MKNSTRRTLSCIGLVALLGGASPAGAAYAATASTGGDGQVCVEVAVTGAPVEVARVVVSGYLQDGRHETDSFALHQNAAAGYDGCSGRYIWGRPDVWHGTVNLRLVINARELGTADVDAGDGKPVRQSWSVVVPEMPPVTDPTPWIPCPPSC